MKQAVLLGLFAILLMTSCEFKNEEDLFKINDTIDSSDFNCDTLNITYSKVSAIFNSNCIACHNDDYNNHNIKLNTYENAKAAAETGLLKKAINHETGVTPMPYGQNKLDTCSVKQIVIWILNKTPQ